MKRSLIITLTSVLAVSTVVGAGLAYWSYKEEVHKDALATTSFNLDEYLGTDMVATKKARLVFNQDEIVLTDQSESFSGSETTYSPITDYSIQYKGSDAQTQMFNEGYFYISKKLYPYLVVSENGHDLFTTSDLPTELETKTELPDCYFLPLISLPNSYDPIHNVRTIYNYDLSFRYNVGPEDSKSYEAFESVMKQSTMGFAFKKTQGEYYVVNFHDSDGTIVTTQRIEKRTEGSISYPKEFGIPNDGFGYQEVNNGQPVETTTVNEKTYTFKEFKFHVFNGWSTTAGGTEVIMKPGGSLSTDTLSVNNVPLNLYPIFNEQTNRLGYVDDGTDMQDQKVIFTAVDDQLGDGSTNDPLYLTLNPDGTASLLKATPAWMEQFPDGKVSLRDSYMGIPLTSIEDAAFAGATDVKELTIPSSVVRIGSTDPSATGAFENCSNMTTVTINAGDIESIGCNTFKNCTSLINVNLPDGLTEIRDNAFQMVDKVREFRLPNTLKRIGPQAFLHMNSLQEMTIPASVEIIGREAFAECVNMTSLTFVSPSENGLIIEEKAFRGCQRIPSIVFPEGLTYIGDECFSQCYNLPSEIVFPSTVTHIGDCIFTNHSGDMTLDFSKLTSLMNPGYEIGKLFADQWGNYAGMWANRTVKLPCAEVEKASLPENLKDMCRHFVNGTYVFTDKTVTTDYSNYTSYWTC